MRLYALACSSVGFSCGGVELGKSDPTLGSMVPNPLKIIGVVDCDTACLIKHRARTRHHVRRYRPQCSLGNTARMSG
jgi:hypothetical protein